MQQRNYITLTGRLSVDNTLRMSRSGQPYRNGIITVERTSGTTDIVHLVIPQTVDVPGTPDTWVTVTGSIAASRRENAPRHEKLTIYVKVERLQLEPTDEPSFNTFRVDTTVAKPVELRHTPLGKLIGEFKVTLRHNLTLPCIVWNNTAMALSHIAAGTRITLIGRLQTREFKYINDDQSIGQSVTTELCVQKFELIADNTVMTTEEQTNDR